MDALLKEKQENDRSKEDYEESLSGYQDAVKVLLEEKKKRDTDMEGLEKSVAAYEVEVDELLKQKETFESQVDSLNSECNELGSQLKFIQNQDEKKATNSKTRYLLYAKSMNSDEEENQSRISEKAKSKKKMSIDGRLQTPPAEQNQTIDTAKSEAPSTALSTTSGLSAVQSSLFSTNQSGSRPSTPCLAFPPRAAGSVDIMDDMLERIKFASNKSIRELEKISTSKKAESSHVIRAASFTEKTNKGGAVSLEETEAFVLDILNKCGKK